MQTAPDPSAFCFKLYRTSLPTCAGPAAQQMFLQARAEDKPNLDSLSDLTLVLSGLRVSKLNISLLIKN